MSSIELRQVSREFDSHTKALDAIDLAIQDGERLVLLGPSGSGKTTILRLIAGLDQPTSGGIWLNHRRIDGVPPHQRDVAMVFQSPTLYPHLDVSGNLEFGLKARGVARADRRDRIAEIATLLKINGLLKRRPAGLSGGERQRVAIGRAIVRRPSVLLLDEPFSSLDVALRASLRQDLVTLHETFRTTLVHVTHDQGEALALGHRIAVLNQGRLVQVASPRQLYERPANRFVASFVGDPPMNMIPRASLAFETSTFLPVESDSLLIGVRPEHVQVRSLDSENPSTTSCFDALAVVRRLEYRGDAILLTLDVSGTPVIACVSASEDFQHGQSVLARIDSERVVWFQDGPDERPAV